MKKGSNEEYQTRIILEKKYYGNRDMSHSENKTQNLWIIIYGEYFGFTYEYNIYKSFCHYLM